MFDAKSEATRIMMKKIANRKKSIPLSRTPSFNVLAIIALAKNEGF
jgi:hypothetical protein